MNYISTFQNGFTCESDGPFAIPDQCVAAYYYCIDGNVYNAVRKEWNKSIYQYTSDKRTFSNPQQCPGDTIFDPLTKICTSPDTVSCRSRSTKLRFSFDVNLTFSLTWSYHHRSDYGHPFSMSIRWTTRHSWRMHQ